MGAPLPFSSTTTNLAGSVLLALPHDVNIGGPLVECLAGLERDRRLAFQLHDGLAFEHVNERMGVVPMDPSCAPGGYDTSIMRPSLPG